MKQHLSEPSNTPTVQLQRGRRKQLVMACIFLASAVLAVALIFNVVPAWVDHRVGPNDSAAETSLVHRFGALSQQYDQLRLGTLATTPDDANQRLRSAMNARLIAGKHLKQLDDTQMQTARSALLMQVNKDLSDFAVAMQDTNASLEAH